MDYKIIETESAADDLQEILAYIVDILCNKEAARSLLDEIESVYSNLKKMPNMYAKCQIERAVELGLHKVPIGNYVMLYKVDEINKTVIVYRYFYGRRDYVEYL